MKKLSFITLATVTSLLNSGLQSEEDPKLSKRKIVSTISNVKRVTKQNKKFTKNPNNLKIIIPPAKVITTFKASKLPKKQDSSESGSSTRLESFETSKKALTPGLATTMLFNDLFVVEFYKAKEEALNRVKNNVIQLNLENKLKL